MSNAVWQPESGQWGIFGTDPSSKAGKVRSAIWEEGTHLPKKTGTSQQIHELTGKDILGLGPEKFFSKGIKGTDIHVGGFGRGLPTRRGMEGEELGLYLGQSIETGQAGGHYQASPKRVKKHWYNPLKQQTLIAPYEQIAGIDTGEGDFITYKGEESLLPQAAIDMPSEQRLLPAGADVEEALEEAGVLKEEARDVYTDTMKGLREAEEETKTGWRTARQETARSRMLAAAAAGEEYEAGETIKAGTGMAYSAPAAERAQLTESTKTMQDLSSAAAETRTGYFKDIKDIKRERSKTEGEWTSAKRDYHGAVKEAYEAAEGALDKTLLKLTGLLGEHQTGTLGGLKPESAQYLEGVKGMFSEGAADVPEYGIIQERLGEAGDFAEIMKSAAHEQIVSDDPSDVSVY